MDISDPVEEEKNRSDPAINLTNDEAQEAAQDSYVVTQEKEEIIGADEGENIQENVVEEIQANVVEQIQENVTESIQENVGERVQENVLETSQENEVEKIPETLESDVVREREDINEDAIPTSDGKETDAPLLESMPDAQTDAGDEAKLEEEKHTEEKGEEIRTEVEGVSEHDELKTGEKAGDGAVESIPIESAEVEVPALDSIVVDVADETTVPFTMRTEEELISNIELDQVRSTIDDESDREALEETRSTSIAESDHSGDEIKSLAPSDEVKGSKESLVSTPSSEEGVEHDEVSGDLSDKSAYQRGEVVEQCKNLLIERKQLRRKNILFHKKLHDYFKKKKAEGTYHEGDSSLVGSASAELHYRKKLLVFNDIQTQVVTERIQIENESKELMDKMDSLQEEAALELELLLTQEEALSHGLIDSQTGKVLSDKVTRRLIHRQGQITKQLSEFMLKYIKIRDKVNATEAALKSLEVLGEGLHLIDYEQLRVEKRALNDKIEERDNELNRLREKIETTIITLSHMDEKSYGTDELVYECHKELKTLTSKLRESREKRTEAQKRLIRIRDETGRLYHEAGLLAHQPLLRDFELLLKQVDQLEIEVNQMKKHVMQGEKVTPQSKKTSLDGSHRKESVKQKCHKKITNGKLKTISKDSLNQNESDKQKPKLMKGRPSVTRLLLNQEK